MVTMIKWVFLSLALLITVPLWPEEANAIPAFARQTNLECKTCHFQHYPVLNKYGRDFKSQGFTMVGENSQTIEGENHLSIPMVLNASVSASVNYQRTNGTNAAPAAGKVPADSTNDGLLSIPQSIRLNLGGRVSSNIGFLAGACLDAACTSGNGALSGFKLPIILNLGDFNAGAVPFSYAQGYAGVGYGFELLNTGAVATHTFNQSDLPSFSAQQYVAVNSPKSARATNALSGVNIAASGIALIASHEYGFINFTKWQPSHLAGGTNGNPTSNYIRLAATPPGLVSNWDIGFGTQIWFGSSAVTTLGAPSILTEAFALDAQFLHDVERFPLTLVISFAKARGSDPLDPVQNVFNDQSANVGGSMDRSSINFGAELGVLPGKATVQLGVRFANSGVNETGPSTAPGVLGTPVSGTNATDNDLMVGATYELMQNVKVTLSFSDSYGSYYNASSFAETVGGKGNQKIVFGMDAGW
ncbi:MAG: hypothetical protein HY200_01410 [Nitrospirae bacterium]|nr:hypothetical protein [Nitrospirota bacterium]